MMSATIYPPQFLGNDTYSISPQISEPFWILQMLKYQPDNYVFFAVRKITLYLAYYGKDANQ